jgi:hypothetical protein
LEPVKANQSNGNIAIELAAGHHLTVEGDFDGDALASLEFSSNTANLCD